MKFRYLIIDDEPLARKLIQSHASKIEGLEEAGVCSTAVEAANLLRKTSVDILFLDIQMPELSGLDFIKSLKHRPAIILTTAYREFAVDAFELDVLDYLMKPIPFDRFLKAVNKFMATSEVPKPTPSAKEAILHVRADRKIYPVLLSDIYFLESLDNYVKIHLKTNVLITHESISSLEERLPTQQFVRIHRSFIINSNAIQSVSSEGINMAGKELPFGRAYKQSAMIRLGLNSKLS